MLTTFVSCDQKLTNNEMSIESPLYDLQWILGSWSNESRQGIIGESWDIVNDSVFSGKGYALAKDGDTTFSESLRLLMHEGFLYYVPTVQGQNDDQPVWFKITGKGENFFTSENKSHDFPQLIKYTLESPEALHVLLEGIVDSVETKREFRFRKAKVRLMP